MKRFFILVASAVLAFHYGSSNLWSHALAGKDQFNGAGIEGTWTELNMEHEGKLRPAASPAKTPKAEQSSGKRIWKIAKDKIEIGPDDKNFPSERWSVKLNEKTSPSEFDAVLQDKEGKEIPEHKMQGIYQVTDDYLLICFSLDGKRPEKFTTTGKSIKTFLALLRRAKQGDGTSSANPAIPFKAPEIIIFKQGPRPLRHHPSYETFFMGHGTDGNPVGSMLYDHLRERGMSWPCVYYHLKNGDLVGVSGGIYFASVGREDANLVRIPVEKLPKGLKPVADDSFTMPLQRPDSSGYTKMGLEWSFYVRSIELKKKSTYVATIDHVEDGVLKTAGVEKGAVLLFGKSGYVVRDIVPHDEKTRVAGWVEFSARTIPESDLIRNKKPYIQPVEKKRP